MTTQRRSFLDRWWSPAVGSLLPWATFLATVAAGDVWTRNAAVNWFDDEVDAAVFCLAVVALPASVALGVARRAARLVVLVVLTAVAVGAGYLVVTTDDPQAGMAVLLIAAVAIGLAVLAGIGRVVLALVRRSRGEPAPLLEEVPFPPAGLLEEVGSPNDRLWSAEHKMLPFHAVPGRPETPDAAGGVWSGATGLNGNGHAPQPFQPLEQVGPPGPSPQSPPQDRAGRRPPPPIPQPRRPFSVPPSRPKP